MIKVQTLRLRGLCASSLLALAACSGTPAEFVDVQTTPVDAAPLSEAATPQEPQGQDPTRRETFARKAIENARRSLDARLFEDARNEAAYALELLSPADGDLFTEARGILDRCNQVLGTAVSPEGNRFNDLVLITKVREDRERANVDNDLEQGEAEMSLGNFGRAIERFERAVTVLRLSEFVQANDPLRKRAELLLQQANEGKAKADLDAVERARNASQAEIDRMARDKEIARELQVSRLLEQANVSFQESRYEECINLIDRALLQDPTNPIAMGLRDLADRARHEVVITNNRERWRNEWMRTFQELQAQLLPQTETVVFDPAKWAEVSRRQPMTYSQASQLEAPENQAIQKLLADTMLEHNFAEATVDDWSTYYARLTGITFYVTQDVKDMDAATTTLTDFRLPRCSVAQALKAIQTQTGIAYRVKDGLVTLVSPDKAIGDLVMQPHNVSDLVMMVRNKPGTDLRLQVPGDDRPMIPEAPEPAVALVDEGRLQELLKATVASDKWDGAPFTMNFLQGTLYVRADRETQKEVTRLLGELRRHVGIQIDIESRFLRVEDNFLEDVGIDLRGLGNQASQGLAGRGLEKQGDRSNAGFDDFGPRNQQNAAAPGIVGTGTTPGIFYDNGGSGDAMARVENLFDTTLGGTQSFQYADLNGTNASGVAQANQSLGPDFNTGLTNAGGFAVQYAFLDDTEVEVVLRAVQKQERSEQIEAPRLIVYNNTRSSMEFLRQIAYIRDFEVEIAQGAAVANPVIGTVYDGVVLDIRPVVDSDLRFIKMELRPSVMTLQLPIPTFTTTLGVGQPISIQLPVVTLQKVRTTVTMPDGSTMMLGGMRVVDRQNLRSTVPLLGNLPGLSWLFSRNGKSTLNRKILILVRGKIVLMDENEPDPRTLPQTGLSMK